MNTREAIDAMLGGKKVRKNWWKDEDYAHFTKYGFKDEDGEKLDSEVLEQSDDCEIYEEPKQKKTVTITIGKWLCRNNGYFIVQGEREYLETMYPLSKVKIIDTYEVEL